MQHFISFQTQDDYSRFMQEEIEKGRWKGAQSVALIPEQEYGDAKGVFWVATLETIKELPMELELETCRMPGVLATNFNQG